MPSTPPHITKRVTDWDRTVEAAYWREVRGLTQAEAADRVGCTSRTLRTWEKDAELWRHARAEALELPPPDAEPVVLALPETRPEPEPGPEATGTGTGSERSGRETPNAAQRVAGGTEVVRTNGTGSDVRKRSHEPPERSSAAAAERRYGRNTLAHRIRDLADETDPLDAVPELALARAVLGDWLETYEDLVAALLAWNAAEERAAAIEERKPRPQRIPQLKDALPFVSEISKAIKRVQDARAANAVSWPRLTELIGEFARAVQYHLTMSPDAPPDGERIAQRILADWSKIRP